MPIIIARFVNSDKFCPPYSWINTNQVATMQMC